MNKLVLRYSILVLCFFTAVIKAQYIKVNTNYTAEQLVKDIFIGPQSAGCVSVSNISVSGWDFGNNDLSYGYFNKNTSNFEMPQGVILSSGSAVHAEGSYSGIQSATDSNWKGDLDLEKAAEITKTFDATILEFDFISHLSNKISFDYMFLSEQYLRNGDPGTCGYTDAFAFLIKKIGDANYTNLAVLPETQVPITSNNVRGVGGKCPASHPEYFGHFNADGSATNFNGQTAILTASTDVIPGEKYHIKLVVADQGNGLYDSAVFLKAGSFVGNKDLGPDRTVSAGTALCEGTSLTLNATTAGAHNYTWYKNGNPIPGATGATYTVTSEGFYEVTFDVSGCLIKGSVFIEYLEKPVLKEITKEYCDPTSSGSFNIQLQMLNAEVEANPNQDFVVKYYLNLSDAQSGNANFLPNVFTLTSDVTLYVRAENGSCVSDVKPLHLKIGSKVPLNTPGNIDICDNELSGNVSVNLADYKNLFSTDNSLSVSYFNTLADAQNNINPINAVVSFNASRSYYYRFESSSGCPNIGTLHFNIKTPKKSLVLKDATTCPDNLATLDAGSGFDFYAWYSEGNTSVPLFSGAGVSSVQVPIGNYFVDLTFDGCIYRQYVKVLASEAPVIDHIDVNGSTVEVFVSGGTSPYQYSLDAINFQSSSVFQNVPRGTHTVYVKSGDGCYIVSGQFIIINLINAITPNGDGINDVLDYSDLKIKNNVSIKIFDRFGQMIFQNQGSNYIWDGKQNGRPVPSGTYWYLLQWEEPGTQQRVQYQDWILVKNRN